MKHLKKILSVTPHYLIVTALLFLTLFITDRFNGAMNFIAHDLTETLIIISGLICWLQALILALGYYKNGKALLAIIISTVAALVGVYLTAICTIDLCLDISRHMLREEYKFTLLAFIILLIASSVAAAAVRRAEIARINEENKENDFKVYIEGILDDDITNGEEHNG